MAEEKTPTVTELFKLWRSGKDDSGQLLAQRVSDWYFAICSSRFGSAHGGELFQSVSQRFGEGIVNVAHSADLIEWAHDLLTTETAQRNIEPIAENTPSPYSGGHLPMDLLNAARSALPAEVRLLNAFFSNDKEADIESMAMALGGMPGALLHARYSIKRWLHREYDLPFNVVPDVPDIDLFPLPMYEANRMTSDNEIAGFERWMLDNTPLCRDVAEFGPFASALRHGLPVSDPKQAEVKAAPTFSTGQRLQVRFANVFLLFGVLLVLVSLFAFTFSIFM